MSEHDSANYHEVKDAVLAAYELIPEAYRQMFRTWAKRGNQTYAEFSREKRLHFEEWLRAEKVTDFEKLKELMLLEDFKTSLPKEIRAHIEEFGFDEVDGAAKAADTYVLSHREVVGNLTRLQ